MPHLGGSIQNCLITVGPSKNSWNEKCYPKDPQIVPYPLATLKCSHALTSWTCADFLKLNNSLGQVVFQSKKVCTRLTHIGVRAFQSCQGVWHYLWVFWVVGWNNIRIWGNLKLI